METHELVPHPSSRPLAVRRIAARITGIDAHWMTLRWRVEGTEALRLPPFAASGRADGLWQTTCFELFAKEAGARAYAEFNFSPSQRWAAYDFVAYREGMAPRPVPRDPVCTPRIGRSVLIFDVALPLAALLARPLDYGLCAVIEEEGGAKSYWAIAHRDEKPDFHHPSCFAARLEAPQTP
nr:MULTISPECIES: DOMON-like domain-containing protein [Novosphingobium]